MALGGPGCGRKRPWPCAQGLIQNWSAGIPLLVFGLICRWVPLLDFRDNTMVFILEGALGCAVAALSLWRWGLAETEREKVSEKVTQRLDRFQENPCMSDPLVSIIMRSFNEGWALKETLPAVQAQEL